MFPIFNDYKVDVTYQIGIRDNAGAEKGPQKTRVFKKTTRAIAREPGNALQQLENVDRIRFERK